MSDPLSYCLLPEWAPQDAVLLSWPPAHSDWHAMMARIEATMEQLALAITRYQPVVISVSDRSTRLRVEKTLLTLGCPAQRLCLIEAPGNDSWARDHGPLTVADSAGNLMLRDYTFTGWGNKFPAELDNGVTRRLAQAGLWNCPLTTSSLVLEGGALETDGHGSLLTTEACLLNPNRNPGMSRQALETRLRDELGLNRVLWLSHGFLEGDDTDSHIDTLARFCSTDTIAYVRCDDRKDPHFAALAAMEHQLRTFRQANGHPYRLIGLPMPRLCRDPDDGHRLPATYANFLIIDGAVLVPVYGDRSDHVALNALSSAFPHHDLIPIDCQSVIRQHGSLHCLTMQLPAGVTRLAPFFTTFQEISCPNAT